MLMWRRAAETVAIYRIPPGRRAFALADLAQRASARGMDAVAAHASLGVAHDRKLMEQEMRFKAGHEGGAYGVDARLIDQLVDRALTGLDGYLDSQERIYGEGSQRGDAASAIRQALFPEGPGAITKLPYGEQHERAGVLLARVADEDLAAHVSALPDLPSMLAELGALNQEYGSVLKDYAQDVPTRVELRQANERGQAYLAETMILALAHFVTAAPEDHEGLDFVLEPVLRQNAMVRDARRRRRRPEDIDPDTGETLEPPAAPAEPAEPDAPVTEPAA